MKPGDNVRTVGMFGAPYLSHEVVYTIRDVEPDGSIRLAGRVGSWWTGGFRYTAERSTADLLYEIHRCECCQTYCGCLCISTLTELDEVRAELRSLQKIRQDDDDSSGRR